MKKKVEKQTYLYLYIKEKRKMKDLFDKDDDLDIYTLLEIRQELMGVRNYIEYTLRLEQHIKKIDDILYIVNKKLNDKDQL